MPAATVSKPSLTRQRIVRAALELADKEGMEALSMRRLAGRLDAGTMTLYGYFRSKEEMIDAMVDAASAELELPSGRGSWKEQLRELMRGVRLVLAEHPVGVELRMRRPMITPAALRVTEAGMRLLQEAGFGTTEAATAYRTLFLYTFGFATFSSPPDPEAARREARAAFARLPPQEFPVLTAAGPAVMDVVAGEEQFELGLSALLDGLEARLG